jgi:alpha-galactosidase
VDFPTVRKLYGQWRKVSPNYFGDYYPLTSYSLDERQWMAWQFDRPESGEGVVQAFRRYKSSYVTACFKLRGLDAKARYVVTDMDSEKASEMTGAELLDKGLTISLPEQASAALISYRKLDRSL